MLTTQLYLRNIRAQSATSLQRLIVSPKLYSSSRAAGSSDSSDSDSDSAGRAKEKGSDAKRGINVAVNQKKFFTRNQQEKAKMPYEKKVIRAAEEVAKEIGDGKNRVASDLLKKLLAGRGTPETAVKEHSVLSKKLTELLQGMEIEKSSVEPKRPPPIKKINTESSNSTLQNSFLFSARVGDVIKSFGTKLPDVPELSTWEALKDRETRLLCTRAPSNAFEEMIRWTEQGKLWRFPIDNEQGMEEERNVHFSEHVFMERYLKDWCPTRGPVRHFMELVCVGLSKNPYMTVDEKVQHIEWYRDYFAEKTTLLKDLGAIDTEITVGQKMIEA